MQQCILRSAEIRVGNNRKPTGLDQISHWQDHDLNTEHNDIQTSDSLKVLSGMPLTLFGIAVSEWASRLRKHSIIIT